MFWLMDWSYMIASSSSSTLLLDILNLHNHVSQSFFCLIICCIQQFHRLIILSNDLFHIGVEFFFNSKTEKKISSTRKRNHCVFNRFACGNLKIFLFSGKISNVDFGLYCSKRKNCQFLRINLLVEAP